MIALKSAGASDKIISAILVKSSSPALTTQTTSASSSSFDGAANSGQQIISSAAPPAQDASQQSSAQTPGKPRIFLASASKELNQNAQRDQSMEMSKDLEKDCTGVRVTINQQMADYTISLNHIEVGLLVRDNQIQVANKDGDLISNTKEGGSIAGGMKKACELILTDWSKK
ncbi:MAG TPA: hypothetical protein VK709_02010 [Candidatus Saccharimonadales bacterium]|nr:hypothetical protein [Candidatus Saccharimonadales bacterium]